MAKDFRKHLRTIQTANDEANPDLPELFPEPPPEQRTPLPAQTGFDIRLGPTDESELGYGQIIANARLVCAVVFGFIGVVVVLGGLAELANDPAAARRELGPSPLFKLLRMLIFPVIMVLFGMALGLGTFAPTSYLLSDHAKKWRKRIGSDNIVVIRGVCGTITAIVLALVCAAVFLIVRSAM